MGIREEFKNNYVSKRVSDYILEWTSTQQKRIIAEKHGFSLSYIHMVVSGKRKINKDNIEAIIELIELSHKNIKAGTKQRKRINKLFDSTKKWKTITKDFTKYLN